MRAGDRRARSRRKFLRDGARSGGVGAARAPPTSAVHKNRRSGAPTFKRVDTRRSGRAVEVQAHLFARGGVGLTGMGGLERAAHEGLGAAGAR